MYSNVQRGDLEWLKRQERFTVGSNKLPHSVGYLHEKNNLINNYPEEVKFIENLLEKFNAEQEDPLFPSSVQIPILIDKYDGQTIEAQDEYIYWSN